VLELHRFLFLLYALRNWYDGDHRGKARRGHPFDSAGPIVHGAWRLSAMFRHAVEKHKSKQGRETMSLFDLSGRVAVITGGNGGIGLGYAQGLASAGCTVSIWGRNEAKNAAAVETLTKAGGKAEARVCDVSSA
jgi:hypothetical protein